MASSLRVPSCFVKHLRYLEESPKFDLHTMKKIKKTYSTIPLLMMTTVVATLAPLFSLHRLLITTIDVRLPDYHRFEIPPHPQFFDLRKPRTLKLRTVEEVKPAIHLDNRYRLMRNEPMLDEEGCKTDQIGEDKTAPPDMKDAAENFQMKSP